MRSGSFANPRPLVAFDCGSQSTNSVFTSAAAKDAARLMAVVVLPTPPFWLATAITRPIRLSGEAELPGSIIRLTFQCNEISVHGDEFVCKTRHVPKGTSFKTALPTPRHKKGSCRNLSVQWRAVQTGEKVLGGTSRLFPSHPQSTFTNFDSLSEAGNEAGS